MQLFSPLENEISQTLNLISTCIDKTFPLPTRFRRDLPKDISELSQLLTNNRGARNETYLNKPAYLSAYIRYFLPWNVFRLCKLLPNLSLSFNYEDAVTDLGSGPLTFPLALWISYPALRNIPLEFRCVDQSSTALNAGKKLFFALAGEKSPWRIKTIRDDINTEIKGKKSAFIFAGNVFNEQFLNIPYKDKHTFSLFTEKTTRLLLRHSENKADILIVEPGIPQCGAFITSLRTLFLESNYTPHFPCTHKESCPFPSGEKTKWCHFTFETEDAPNDLLKLSEKAKLPKERASISFLFVSLKEKKNLKEETLSTRIISDSFPIQMQNRTGVYGRYACSGKGMLLISGTKTVIEKQKSGAVLFVKLKGNEKRDSKTNALMIELQE